ncbi:MAG: histidine triad nucleotide-binding protein [Candidatus Electryonea clarkiae]|nr:histidine triad nucleotide-binding protein [Candidatus Electryonea clarkiae]MDP8286748.1 histidine triad nucleotide-binding protein [Candidatus Electryonea clarkiae]
MEYDSNGIFAKILRGEIPTNSVYENENVLAFEDINPKAPVHILIIPKADVPTVNEFGPEHKEMIGDMILAAKEIAAEKGIAESGYRMVINTLDDGGQELYHVHLHLLGGRRMKWPPG